MAIECLDEAIRRVGPAIYVYHEIVHNKYVVDRFTGQGVKFVNSLEEVPVGGILLFSAHGVSPEIRQIARYRKLQTVDATCPLVTKVHLEAIRYANQGYNIILIGHEGHDEVIGTMGEAPESITLVETSDDVNRLPFTQGDKLAYLTQTTLSVEEANSVIQALRNRYPNIDSPKKEDICYATTNRQEAVKAIAPRSDVVLVIGAPNSSNSMRLVEVASRAGVKRSSLVQRASDIDWSMIGDARVVGLTAGASAPDVLIQEVIDAFRSRYDVTVEETETARETVQFRLPRALLNN
jgi:4-hydroxy-3-methylbut-2-enyl diphosphate reductase